MTISPPVRNGCGARRMIPPVEEPFGIDSVEDGIWPRDPSAMPQFCYPEAARPTTAQSTSYTSPQRYGASNPNEEDK